jgi:hypothetical protein
MAVLGSTSKPATTQEWFGLNTTNQIAMQLTLPSGGPWRIHRLGAWLAGMNMNASARLCLWTSGGTLVRNGSTFTAASMGFALGNTANYEQDISDYVVSGGTTVYVGFSRNPAHSVQNGMTGSGSHTHDYKSSWPGNLSGFSTHTGQTGAYLYYEASNSAPTAPSLTSPANGGRITASNNPPLYKWTHNDPDNDPQFAYQVQVDTSSSFTNPLDTGKVTSSTQQHQGANALAVGSLYYWRVRTWDTSNEVSPWSATRNFRVNRLPTATKTSPVNNGFPVIHNLATDLTSWSSGGSHSRPRFTWTFSDPDGDAKSGHRVRIYSASSGGSLLHDSGVVANNHLHYDAPWAGVQGTQYWWTLDVRDAYNEWSGESSRTGFKMRWAQGQYQFQLPALGTSSWSWSAAALVNPGQVGYLFRAASGANGSGATAWKSSIGAVQRITSGTEYLNVAVRLAATTPGSNPSLPDMTFRYVAGGIQPDQWSYFGTANDWLLDSEMRRFGSQSLRFTASSTAFKAAYQDVSVSPNTEYTLSAYVNTGATPTEGTVRLRLYDTAWPGAGGERSDLYLDTSRFQTQDTSGAREGWQRLALRFRTADQNRLRLGITFGVAPVVGDMFWVDSVQLEESTMPTPWQPGLAGDAAVVDVGGVVIDGVNGGIFRMRTSDGNVASLDQHTLSTPAIGNVVRKTSTQSITTSTWTKITAYTNTDFTARGMTWSAYGGSEIRADMPGLYLIQARGNFTIGATGGVRRLMGLTFANAATPGATPDEFNRVEQVSTAGVPYLEITRLVYLNVNDTVAAACWHDHGSSVNFTNVILSAARIGT